MREPVPPNPFVRDAVERGIIPKAWVDRWNGEQAARCICSHHEAAHPSGGACSTKVCRRFGTCSAFRLDRRFTLPEWGTRRVTVSPVVPAKA